MIYDEIVVGGAATVTTSAPSITVGVLASVSAQTGELRSLDGLPLNDGVGQTQSRIDSIVAGRDFEERDIVPAAEAATSESRVAIVSESFAKRYFKDGRAVGMRLGMGKDPGTTLTTEIIGVAKDTLYHDVKDEVPYVVFFPTLSASGSVILETGRPASEIFPAIRAAVRDIDPNLPVYRMRTIDTMLRQSARNERLMASLSAVFGLLATLLAAIGLYGVLAYTVVQRTREIGLRMALGAAPSRVRAMVLGQVSRMTIIGGLVGLFAAWGLSRLAQSLLYQMSGSDPIVLAGSAAALTLVALAAGFVPALRASRVEPMSALRYE